ncbi:ABC transporter ATP-binding protein [Lutispora sp.]|uniref:ABC transporter ATP-binding protein n=1 Tax=Lutispora sp. TaxID=2828727 RepID=UPI002B20D141|nr:ABC transporter ATP-binding protein [Lutispora sp.]MEA4960059.1 ABC transporter ATP-binding protein [Lutispora sp.]
MGLEALDIHVKYGRKEILNSVSLKINDGEITTIIGPNGSGKSTLIKVLSRCLSPWKGSVYLDGKNLKDIGTKKIAEKLAVLPQIRHLSSDITVEELVAHGRYPHLGFRQKLRKEDREIIEWSMIKTGLMELRYRHVVTLSGGEKQRAWMAMTLAQKTGILILDEPTTFLDISYQLEVLELIKELNASLGLTVIMVLHDLNQAARYSDNIHVLDRGRICEWGPPDKILRSDLIKRVFKIQAHIYEDDINQCLYFIPEKRV